MQQTQELPRITKAQTLDELAYLHIKDAILNGVEHTNFFENRATEYSKAATRGTWGS